MFEGAEAQTGARRHSADPGRGHRRLATLLAVVSLMVSLLPLTRASATEAGPVDTVSLLVKLVPGLSDADAAAVIARHGGIRTRTVAPLRLHVVEVATTDAERVVASYLADTGFVERADQDRVRRIEAAPSDPAYGDQWALAKIGWDAARDAVTPAGSATIAVLDTGVDGANPDFAGRLVGGYSAFAGGSATDDPHGHGTWMASIAAAATDNAHGIAGVAYAGARVMPVQVVGADGTGQDSDIIAGLVHAADAGADVVLMAFSNTGFSQDLQDAVEYAWAKGAVLVAAVGNDGGSTVTYPAGDAKVVGVSATDDTDALWAGSNHGQAAFLAAPGVGVLADAVGGGTRSVTGTSASAAIVAGAAAVLRANDPAASNATVVGRLARTADAAGTRDQTGNGRVNLARAVADASTDPVVPTGAAPVGSGGPFVGPYVVAANVSGQLQGQNNPPCASGGTCPWQTANLQGWAELQTVPLRLFLGPNQQNHNPGSFTIDLDRSDSGSAGLEGLTNFAPSSNATMSAVTFSKNTIGSGAETYSYTFTVNMTNNLAGEIRFDTRLMAGAHNFSGKSLQVKGAGTLGFNKPGPAPGTPDLTLTKTALTAVSPGQQLTYTLSYRNAATGSANGATRVQMTDVLPAQVTYVNGSCSGCVYDTLAKTLSWDLGSIAAGSATATRTYKVTVNTSLSNGTPFTNDARILSAENDANLADNASKVTTIALSLIHI